MSANERVRRVEADPPIAQSGNVIRLGAPRGLWAWDGISIGFDVIVPPDARVRTRSGSGDQIVGSVRGPVDASKCVPAATARAGAGRRTAHRHHDRIRGYQDSIR